MVDEWIVETHDLVKKYGEHVALDSVNLNIKPGATGLLGPNGAGKSTTIKLLTGRIRPSSGKIRINGIDPWKDRVTVNSMIGYLPQNSIQ